MPTPPALAAHSPPETGRGAPGSRGDGAARGEEGEKGEKSTNLEPPEIKFLPILKHRSYIGGHLGGY